MPNPPVLRWKKKGIKIKKRKKGKSFRQIEPHFSKTQNIYCSHLRLHFSIYWGRKVSLFIRCRHTLHSVNGWIELSAFLVQFLHCLTTDVLRSSFNCRRLHHKATQFLYVCSCTSRHSVYIFRQRLSKARTAATLVDNSVEGRLFVVSQLLFALLLLCHWEYDTVMPLMLPLCVACRLCLCLIRSTHSIWPCKAF